MVEGEAGVAEAYQDLSQGAVVFEDGPAEEDSLTGTGVEVVINGPRRGDAVFVKKPLLPDTGGENRVLDVKKECASGLQSAINLLKNRAQVGHIVEDEVGDHQVEYGCWVVVFLQIADTVGDARVRIARLCLPNHPLALVDAQHRGRTVVGGIFAVPAVAAAQVQHGLANERRDEWLKLVPLPGGGKPLPAPGHLGVGGEKIVGVVEIVHKIRTSNQNQHQNTTPVSGLPELFGVWPLLAVVEEDGRMSVRTAKPCSGRVKGRPKGVRSRLIYQMPKTSSTHPIIACSQSIPFFRFFQP